MRRPARRAIFATVIAAAVTACMPVAAPIADGAPEGPQLAIEVVNSSDRELEIGYDFENGSSSGGGGGTVSGCTRVALSFGVIGGRYKILLDGESLLEGTVPAGAGDSVWVVVLVHVDAGAEGEVIRTRVAAEMPGPDPRPIAGCS